MDDEARTTTMIRYECYACGQSATCVLNETAEQAWSWHMLEHLDQDYYGSWVWQVMPLPLEHRV